MKIGDTLPPRKGTPLPCPECKNEVFKIYPSGFVNEIDTVIAGTVIGFTVKEHWHCPACGYHEDHFHEVNSNGLRLDTNSNNLEFSTSYTSGTTHTFPTNSSHNSRHKKRNRK